MKLALLISLMTFSYIQTAPPPDGRAVGIGLKGEILDLVEVAAQDMLKNPLIPEKDRNLENYFIRLEGQKGHEYLVYFEPKSFGDEKFVGGGPFRYRIDMRTHKIITRERPF